MRHAVEVVGQEGAALASFFPARAEHEVVDDELAAAPKRSASVSGRSGLRTHNSSRRVPGQLAALAAELVAPAREFLFSGQVRRARLEPFVSRYHFVLRFVAVIEFPFSGYARAQVSCIRAVVYGYPVQGASSRLGPGLGGLASASSLMRSRWLDQSSSKRPDPALINLPDGDHVQRVHPLAALFTRMNQAGLAEHVNVFHDPEAAQVRKGLDDLGRGARAMPQEVENRAPRAVGQSFPHAVEIVHGHLAPLRISARGASWATPSGCASSRW